MKIDPVFAMIDSELAMKKCAEKYGMEYFFRPITYDEFKGMREEVTSLHAKYITHQSKDVLDLRQHTIEDVGGEENSENVEIVSHMRYSLPVLHNHVFIEMIYVYSGKCLNFIKDTVIEMKTGDICFLAPNTIHALSVFDDNSVVINFLLSKRMFDEAFLRLMKHGEEISGFFESILFERKTSAYILYPTGDDEWLHNTAVAMKKESIRRDRLYNASISLYVKQIFIHILRNYEMKAIVADPITNGQDNKIVSLMGYIRLNYKTVTLQSIADYFGYSKSFLSQIISKHMGKNFMSVVNEEKMKNAAVLLRETNFSLTKIGSEVGCYDSSHFSHMFRKMYGMTPKEYRQKMHRDEENQANESW